MTEPRDTSQAVEHLAWSLRGPSSQAWVQKDDLRAVLADCQHMRDSLARIAHLADVAARDKPNAAAYIPTYLRMIREQADAGRLVGEWRPADEEQAR